MESPQLISAAHHPYERLKQEDKEEDDSSSNDFEFALVKTDPGTGLTANDIFSDGQILPVYPVFNRDILAGGRLSASEEEKTVRHSFGQLLLEEQAARTDSASSSASSGFDKNEVLPEGNYCVPAPRSPEWSKKSSSTGSASSRRWGLREIFTNRSHSDGKEKFVLLERPPPVSGVLKPNPKASLAARAVTEGEKGKSGKGTKGGKATEMDMVTAHRLYYGKSSGQGQGVNGSRRSYLPYRQELLVGFFSNGTRH